MLAQLDYQAWGEITFDTDHALFADGPLPVTFFHPAKFFQDSVKIHAVDAGQAREVLYNQAYFHMPADSPARGLPRGAGFAGFRVQEPRGGPLDWRTNDWAAFLGASYFRAIGALRQYGLSARAVAIDTAGLSAPGGIPPLQPGFHRAPGDRLGRHCCQRLLEGSAVTGACRMRLTRALGW